MQSLVSRRSGPLSGRVRVPGDKSISHRALMLGALAQGVTVIDGLLEGEDVHRTAAAMAALGAAITAGADGRWRVEGVGDRPLSEPAAVLDMGNSGTSTRLLSGVVAGQPLTAFMTGDASLTKRPMARVTEPLSRMGARFVTRTGGRLPMAVIGTDRLQPIRYVLPVASAQVKSAILLAGLAAAGTTTVVEREATRDHSELMLRHFGVEVRVGPAAEGGEAISILGGQRLTGRPVIVPADISSAAFPMVAALIRPGSSILLEGVGVNPRRAGLIQTLVEMGARIRLENGRLDSGEPVADLAIEYGALTGIEVPPERAPSMIDEYPVLAVAAACANGTTHMRGLAELRVKESDRLAVVADGLSRCGVRVDVGNDSLTVYGTGKPPAGGATVETQLDHRIAMSFLVLGAATAEPVAVDDAAPIDTSFPGFAALMNGLGASIALLGERR